MIPNCKKNRCLVEGSACQNLCAVCLDRPLLVTAIPSISGTKRSVGSLCIVSLTACGKVLVVVTGHPLTKDANTLFGFS